MTALRNRFPLCVVWMLVAASASRAESPVALPANIRPQPLAEALTEFGQQTGLQLIYASSIAETQRSKGAQAGFDASAALSQLLEGTGLRFEFLNVRTVGIFPALPTPTIIPSSPVPRHRSERSPDNSFEDVIVTATRREEQLNRVPISMTVWTEETMEASGIKGMVQLGALTPGVNFGFRAGLGGDLYTDIAMRGVYERHGSTVSIYADDTQIPPARVGTYLRSFPLTFDLDRVEIMRGPQSTLLGDHTQGGAVRFVMNQPSLTESSGLARIEWGEPAHGGTNYELGAAAGGPIVSDVLGYRVSGWYREDGGYVDRADPFTGATVDANASRYVTKTMRGALTYAPEEAVRVTPSLTYQSTSIDDTSAFDPALSNPGSGRFRNDSLARQPFNDTYYLASLKVTAAFPLAELTSLTSYFDRTAAATIDITTFPPFPTSFADAVAWHPAIAQRLFTQEVRFTSADHNAALTWLGGTFYSKERARHSERTVASGLTDPGDATDFEKTQLDGFGQIAIMLSKRLTASAGLRIGHSKHDYLTEAPPASKGAASDTWMAPRLVLSWQANEHDLFYLSAAKGYGSGGVYDPATRDVYPPDTLWSYELGSKSDLWHGRAHLDASIFHARWNNGPPNYNQPESEQLQVPGPVVSNGFDVAVNALATERVTLALAAEYVDAHYTRTLKLGDTVFVREGDSIYTSPWSVLASLEWNFLVGVDLTAGVRIEDVYRSKSPVNLPTPIFTEPTVHDQAKPSSNLLNLRAHVRWRRFDVAALMTNALDSHPTVGGGFYTFFPNRALLLSPRTLSISGTWRF